MSRKTNRLRARVDVERKRADAAEAAAVRIMASVRCTFEGGTFCRVVLDVGGNTYTIARAIIKEIKQIDGPSVEFRFHATERIYARNINIS